MEDDWFILFSCYLTRRLVSLPILLFLYLLMNMKNLLYSVPVKDFFTECSKQKIVEDYDIISRREEVGIVL